MAKPEKRRIGLLVEASLKLVSLSLTSNALLAKGGVEHAMLAKLLL